MSRSQKCERCTQECVRNGDAKGMASPGLTVPPRLLPPSTVGYMLTLRCHSRKRFRVL
jgi:hypothetical protein